jgi:hypothetical protein
MQGQTVPFHAMFAIRVWDKTRDGLNAKAGAIKNAINSMNAAQYFESNLPSTSKNLFFQTWPGWTWGRYEHRKLYAEHRFLADMLPVTSTFTGHLATAEAIYDGPHDNLVGIETFSGSDDNKTPQHVGVDDARPDGRGARSDHGDCDAHPSVVSRRQLRLPLRRHEQPLAHREGRALRVGLYPGIGEGIEGRGGFPHHQSRAQAHHDVAARLAEAECL